MGRWAGSPHDGRRTGGMGKVQRGPHFRRSCGAASRLLLRHCGLDPTNEHARRGVTLIWEGARYFDGGLTPASLSMPQKLRYFPLPSAGLSLRCRPPQRRRRPGVADGQPARRRRLELSNGPVRRPPQLLPHLYLRPRRPPTTMSQRRHLASAEQTPWPGLVRHGTNRQAQPLEHCCVSGSETMSLAPCSPIPVRARCGLTGCAAAGSIS